MDASAPPPPEKPPQIERPLVIYDGKCGICSASLRWLRRLDWLNRFEALPLQSDEPYRRFPSLQRGLCEEALHLAFPDGRLFSGADALREILLRMPATAILGALLALPPIRQIARKLYPIAARQRHSWRAASCRVQSRRDPRNP